MNIFSDGDMRSASVSNHLFLANRHRNSKSSITDFLMYTGTGFVQFFAGAISLASVIYCVAHDEIDSFVHELFSSQLSCFEAMSVDHETSIHKELDAPHFKNVCTSSFLSAPISPATDGDSPDAAQSRTLSGLRVLSEKEDCSTLPLSTTNLVRLNRRYTTAHKSRNVSMEDFKAQINVAILLASQAFFDLSILCK